MVRRRRARNLGKRIIYITPYRNAAVEVMRMYKEKGETVGIEREIDPTGRTLFVVYTFA